MPRSPRAQGLVTFGIVVTLAGCTLASPTYITTQSGPEAKADASATASSSTLTSGPASDGTTTSCAGGTFTKVDPAKLTACGNGLGHCYDKTKTPGAEQLVACPNPSEVCVPDDILAAGGGKLQSCTSIIGPGGCVAGALFPQIAAQGGGALKQDVCSAGHICVPCTDPTHGNAPTPFCQPIGVMATACTGGGGAVDAGAPPPPSQPCCTKNGRSNGICIAETAVPEARRSQTIQDTCSGGNRCVPSALAAGNPSTCNAGSSKGVCMDTCFNDMLNIAASIGFLGQDWCGSTEVCIPCSMVSGQGVPGCP